jgi:hypothetical protein
LWLTVPYGENLAADSPAAISALAAPLGSQLPRCERHFLPFLNPLPSAIRLTPQGL